MSEPIQSISQGNYILQTTISTSAGVVGDGSPNNPLRADETVLYSGAFIAQSTNTATITEPITNFETIKIYAARDTNTRAPKASEFQVMSSTASPYCIENTFYNSSGAFYNDRAQLNFNDTTVSCSVNVRILFNASGYTLYNNTPLTISKIVGINRKSQ